jgi:hypothetical protein
MGDLAGQFGTWYGHGRKGPGFNIFAGFWPDFKGQALVLVLFLNNNKLDALKLCWQLLEQAHV